MEQMIKKLLYDHGTDMVLTGGAGSKIVRGFFRAVNSKSWQSMESEATLLGEITRGQYAYIGPADGGAMEGDALEVGGKSYLLRRVEYYYYKDLALYQWGLCVEKGVNDVWGSQS